MKMEGMQEGEEEQKVAFGETLKRQNGPLGMESL